MALGLATGTLRFTFSYESSSPSPARAEDYLNGPGFKTFTATDGQFTADFPTFPQRLTGTSRPGGVTVRNVEYESQPTSQDTFAVLVVTFPRPISSDGDVQDFLNNTANSEAAAMRGVIRQSTFLQVDGHPAIDVVYRAAGSDRAHERFIVVGAVQYAVAVVGSARALSTYDRFATSFHPLQSVPDSTP